ncbi:hypothetical protein [Psychroserpens luteus]|uniref:Uncharacterized protein n=1 Tax=Psychroserpens luteus TaxID=1434066 RepID=A0ABW5ZV01_9FLAO|nr:hypothetical protein [Psychroserpens luteus]
MKLREKRRILLFLELLVERLQSENIKGIHKNLKQYITREELIEMVMWLFHKTWTPKTLAIKSDEDLFNLIGNDIGILLFIIEKLESSMVSYPEFEQKDIDEFFFRTQNEIHYLAHKPVDQWDEYDISNYRSMLLKTGTTKKVFGIFTADVLSEDAYAVTTKPSYFFDTHEEAEAKIKNIELEGQFKTDELTIHKLYLLQ